MKIEIKIFTAFTATMLISGFVASATPVTPAYDTFGTLSGATFGGTGIPNNAVAISTITSGRDTITLGLTATPRYSSPAVGNNGAGTFYATPGAAGGYSLWNFDFYIKLADNTGANYSFALRYANNTTGASSLFSFGPASNASGTSQDSWNLAMAFLNTISFDPNANAIYGFELEAFDAQGAQVGKSAINVNVGSVPDTASTGLLLCLGLGGLALLPSAKGRFQKSA